MKKEDLKKMFKNVQQQYSRLEKLDGEIVIGKYANYPNPDQLRRDWKTSLKTTLDHSLDPLIRYIRKEEGESSQVYKDLMTVFSGFEEVLQAMSSVSLERRRGSVFPQLRRISNAVFRQQSYFTG